MTIAILNRKFYWLDSGREVQRFVRNCNVYGRAKVWREKKRGLLKPLLIP